MYQVKIPDLGNSMCRKLKTKVNDNIVTKNIGVIFGRVEVIIK